MKVVLLRFLCAKTLSNWLEGAMIASSEMKGTVMTTKKERIVERIEGASGGTGILRKEVLIDKEQMGEHCGLFGEVTLEPGAVLGYHEHHGETETYYILSGNGVYVDNGEEIPAKEGDVFFCKDGDGHGLKNTGESDLVFVALILKK